MIWNKILGKKQEISSSSDDDLSVVDEDNSSFEKLFYFDDEVIEEVKKEEGKQSSFSKLFSSIYKSRSAVVGSISKSFTHKKLSLDALDDFEDILISADLGVKTSAMLRDKLEEEKFDKNISPEDIFEFLQDEIEELLSPSQELLKIKRNANPFVMTFVGVNGTGKTTTIGKYAHHFKQAGLSVMLVAGDTYRAAATEQLSVWGQRNNVDVVTAGQGGDAAGLVYDAYEKAKEKNIDILLVDTAGRLQNKHNLMQELLKITRVLQKFDMELPHETILVLDATTGQNAVKQAEVFRDMADISGMIVTKLDGSAKGGVLVSIAHMLKLPIYAVGIGEKIEDLRPFNAKDFAKALTDI